MLITEDNDRMELIDELIDRYGEPPKSVIGLIEVSLLRNKAAHLGITEITQRNGAMYFYIEHPNMQQISALSAAYKGIITFNSISVPYISVKIKPKVRPFDMMKNVVKITKEYDIPTMVSLNPIMIDGTGMCGGCRVNIGGETKFACVDGPDFDGFKVNFDECMQRQGMFREEEHECRIGRGM